MSFNKFEIVLIVLVVNTIPQFPMKKVILLKLKKNGALVKLFRGTCVTWKSKKSLIVSDQNIQSEGLGAFLKHIGKVAKNVGRKILNNPGRKLH